MKKNQNQTKEFFENNEIKNELNKIKKKQKEKLIVIVFNMKQISKYLIFGNFEQ